MIRIVIETGPQGFSINGIPDNTIQALGILETAKLMIIQKALKDMNQQQVTPVPANVLAELNSRK